MVSPTADRIASAINDRSVAGDWGTVCDASLAFETPALIALSKLWHAKAATLGHPPARSDFAARELKSLLGNIAIIERVGHDNPRYRCRYYGTEFVHLMGEQTGRFMDEFIPPNLLPRWTMGYEAAGALGAPLRFTSRFQLPELSYLTGEMFVAPFHSGPGRNTTFLSAMYVQPKHAFAEAV
jgi:hypothetical protein